MENKIYVSWIVTYNGEVRRAIGTMNRDLMESIIDKKQDLVNAGLDCESVSHILLEQFKNKQKFENSVVTLLALNNTRGELGNVLTLSMILNEDGAQTKIRSFEVLDEITEDFIFHLNCEGFNELIRNNQDMIPEEYRQEVGELMNA